MFKKTFLHTIIFIFFLIFPTNKVYGAKLYLDPPTGTYAVGQPFQSRIMLDTEGAATAGTDVFINFDSTILNATRIQEGSLYDTYLGKNVDNEKGALAISGIFDIDNETGYSGIGIFATIVFEGKSPGTSKVSFDFSPGEVNDSNVSVLASTSDNLTSATGATYTISASPSSPSPTSGPSSPSPSPSPAPRGGPAAQTTLSPSPSPTPSSSPTPETLPKSGTLSNTIKAAAPGIILFVLSVLLVI